MAETQVSEGLKASSQQNRLRCIDACVSWSALDLRKTAQAPRSGGTCKGGEPLDLLVLGQASKRGGHVELGEVRSRQSAEQVEVHRRMCKQTGEPLTQTCNACALTTPIRPPGPHHLWYGLATYAPPFTNG